MCRNIRILFNFDPPTTDDEIQAAALQFVRKVSGSPHVSRTNQETFDRAVEEIAASTRKLVRGLVTTAPPRNRDEERQKARARSVRRFGAS
jgi:hypothetical protein